MGLATGCSEEIGEVKVTGVDVQCVGADDICEDMSVNCVWADDLCIGVDVDSAPTARSACRLSPIWSCSSCYMHSKRL